MARQRMILLALLVGLAGTGCKDFNGPRKAAVNNTPASSKTTPPPPKAVVAAQKPSAFSGVMMRSR